MFIFQEKLTLEVYRNSFFFQYILCELNTQNEVGYIVVICRAPSQSLTEFDDFLVSFEKLLNHVRQLKSPLLVILGDLMLNPNHGGMRL